VRTGLLDLRTFIAVDFPPEMLEKIGEISTFFRQKTSENALKWVETGNLHLTLKFIGEINDNTLEQVEHTLSHSLNGQKAFEIQVSGLGMYPNKMAPRVIWLGITGGDPLVKIHHILDKNLAVLDIKPEGRALSPHLTIARVRKNVDKATAKKIGDTLAQFKVESLGTITIDRVHLYQSILTPSGPNYTVLHSVPLNQV
jgi:RNA 2',3'-cyclic 3'-phosphodiesterase